MKRWIRTTVVALLAGSALTYLGDWAVFRLRGSPVATVTVNRYLTVPLKGGKVEYDYLGTADVPCARSIFPQGAMSACWQLRRNANQTTAL